MVVSGSFSLTTSFTQNWVADANAVLFLERHVFASVYLHNMCCLVLTLFQVTIGFLASQKDQERGVVFYGHAASAAQKSFTSKRFR